MTRLVPSRVCNSQGPGVHEREDACEGEWWRHSDPKVGGRFAVEVSANVKNKAMLYEFYFSRPDSLVHRIVYGHLPQYFFWTSTCSVKSASERECEFRHMQCVHSQNTWLKPRVACNFGEGQTDEHNICVQARLGGHATRGERGFSRERVYFARSFV